MPTLMDAQVGMKKETTYGNPVVVDRFYPVLKGSGAQWDTRPRQGEGVRGSQGRSAPSADLPLSLIHI